jgi:hypothetical protein
MPTTRVHDLIEIASRLSKVPVSDITGRGKLAYIVRVRHAVFHVAISQGVHSTPQIGRFMRRDHSTVIHGNNQAKNHAARDPEYAHFIQRLKDEAAIADPFLADWGEQYEFAMPKPIAAVTPKTKPIQEPEPFYFGGGYSMNREAAA